MVIGLDLDNTLVGYEELFPVAAAELGLFTPDELSELSARAPGKTPLRDALRARPGGEYQWRDVQALVYGREIMNARPFPGVLPFLARCRELSLPVFVVSHKTPTASCRGQIFDLRQVALAWLEKAGLFNPAASPLTPEHVFFAATRAEKLARIAELGCRVFVDDLVELFLEPDFPPGVAQVLLDPSGQAGQRHPEFRGALARSWAEVAALVLGPLEAPDAALAARAGELLGARAAGFRRIFAGGNSRVWRMDLEGGGSAALKHYFRHADDPRDRLGVEFGALTRLWDSGISELRAAIPRPLAAAPEQGLALYGFVEGEAAGAPGEGELAQAVGFLGLLRRAGNAFAGFPWASDACKSGADLAGLVEARLETLEQAERAGNSSGLFREMIDFVTGPLRETLAAVENRGRRLLGPDWERELPEAGRVPSPSDFGFHNALRRSGGQVVFLDFEYFGWDDPAKLVSDFLLHPRNPLPAQLKTCFLRQSLELYGDLPGAGSRLLALYPLVGLAWCAIMLNVFTRASLERREFAGAGAGEELLAAQLGKARGLLEGLRRWLDEARELTALGPEQAHLFPHVDLHTGPHAGPHTGR